MYPVVSAGAMWLFWIGERHWHSPGPFATILDAAVLPQTLWSTSEPGERRRLFSLNGQERVGL